MKWTHKYTCWVPGETSEADDFTYERDSPEEAAKAYAQGCEEGEILSDRTLRTTTSRSRGCTAANSLRPRRKT